MPAGRPSVYDPKFCQIIIDLAKQGEFEAAWANACDVSKACIKNWSKDEDKPEFVAAFARARQECEAFWDKQTAISAINNTGSAPLLKFLQAAVFGKKEVSVTEHAGEITQKVIQVDFAERPED